MKHTSISIFARNILNRSLYPYQIEIGNSIIESVLQRKGLTFSILMARQTGKNEVSAVVESYLLACMAEGTIVKCAPSWKPQAVNSRLRLLSMLEGSPLSNRLWRSFGYIIGLAPSPEQVRAQAGPRVMLFSASPGSHVVGATASLLLEIDEAQDVSQEKFDTELRPMASTTAATTVLYGTAWSESTLLARQSAHNRQLEEQDGIRRHFEYDWRTLAALNPQYKRFVESEIARLGEEHISIRTQYMLKTISGADFLLNDLQRYLLKGTHGWQEEPDEDGDYAYVAGCDVGGEERPRLGVGSQPNGKRDSTVLTIGRVSYNTLDLPRIEIVHHYWWTGMHHGDQYAAVAAIMQQWNIRKLVVDATGLGEALASLLIDRFGAERVTAFKISRPSKSQLAYHFLSMINSARLKIYSQEDAPTHIYEECCQQMKLARYRVPAEGILDFFVPSEEGHDDFLLSTALCCEAVRDFAAPIVETLIIKPRTLYNDGLF